MVRETMNVKEKEQYIIGIDIGGSNTSVGAVDKTGQVLSRLREATNPTAGPESGVRRIKAMVVEAMRQAEIEHEQLLGIGIGCTGPVEPDTGRIMNPYTLPTWEGFNIFTPFLEAFKVPVALENDADAAALGEFWAGAGQGTRNMVYVTISTGVGGGLILNGQLYTGVGLTAGELGHQVVDVNGLPCYCGARGCMETMTSGPAIAREARQRIAEEQSAILAMVGGDREAITAKVVTEAARAGDALALSIIEQSAFYLGIGLSNVITILAPDMIVMGGGVMRSWDLFADKVKETIANTVSHVPYEQVAIVPAALGQDAGLIGAAKALLDRKR